MKDEPQSTIINNASNYGAQGVFNGPVTFQQILNHTPIPYRTIVLRMVEDYAAVFGRRTHELAALDAWLEAGNDPFSLLIAPTGRGKTVLLIHWVAQVQTYGRWSVVFAPISLRYGTASADMTLRALAHALAAVHNEHEHLQTLNQSPDQLRPLIAEYLRRPLPDNRRLLLVLDGLDEATGWQLARDLFPRTPGPHLRILAAARQLAHKSLSDWCEQLGWQPARTFDVTLGSLNHAAVEDVLLQMEDPLGHRADRAAVVSELTCISQGDPLTIRLLIEALQHTEITPNQLTRMSPTLESYMRDWLAELRHQADHSGVDMLLRLCAGALGPLHSTDLRTLALHAFPRHLDVQSAAERVQRFVMGDGTAENGCIFSHPGLRELFWERLLDSDERAAVTQQFLAYGELQYDTYCEQLGNAPMRILSPYVLLFWPTHLALHSHWKRLYEVVAEVLPAGDAYVQPWAEARFNVENSYVGYLSDLDHLWRHAEATSNVVLGVRCALLAASIRSLSSHFSPELLVELVTVGTPEGKWSVPLALAYG